MPRISVLIPTMDRAATLPYAVRSVQAQGVDDLEILICGDGATDAVRNTVRTLQQSDRRIRFFDLPKAPARGELNRDHVLRQAEGELIFHQNDDDLWLPDHVAMLQHALEDADFVGAMQVNVQTDGSVRAWFFDGARSEYRLPWLGWTENGLGPWASNGCSPIFVAHRRDAFLRLPEGWVTTPPGLPADQAMWHRFAQQPWCRMRFLEWPVALQFYSGDRPDWTMEQRADELRRWTEIIERPDYAVQIWRSLLPGLGDRLLEQALADREVRANLIASVTRLETERNAARAELIAARADRATWQALEKHLKDVLSSTSWRVLAPLRAAVDWMKRIGR
jgi:hypothetical protein